METLTLRTADGLDLLLRHWPAAGPACGTVLLVHGLGEHAGRYAHVAQALNHAGWHVVGHDQRGHGRSGGRQGVLASAGDLLADLGAVVDAVSDGRLTLSPGPRVLLGHSMGGAVAARFVAEALAPQPAAWWRPMDGLVLSSPALLARLSRWQRLQLALGERLMPDMPQRNGIQPRELSHDPAMVQAYVDDPLVHPRISARLARFILDAGNQVRAAAPRWTLPTLLMWGGADRIVDPAGSHAFARAAPAAVLTAFEFGGLRHEIFNELEREGVLMRLTHWLGRFQTAASPAPTRRPTP